MAVKRFRTRNPLCITEISKVETKPKRMVVERLKRLETGSKPMRRGGRKVFIIPVATMDAAAKAWLARWQITNLSKFFLSIQLTGRLKVFLNVPLK